MGCLSTQAKVPLMKENTTNTAIKDIILFNVHHDAQEDYWIEQIARTPSQTTCLFNDFESIHKSVPTRICRLFCGNINCKYENWKLNHNKNAIDGLHSNFINPNILATQRPTERIIKEYDLINQFSK
jgi:hypothetical protein